MLAVIVTIYRFKLIDFYYKLIDLILYGIDSLYCSKWLKTHDKFPTDIATTQLISLGWQVELISLLIPNAPFLYPVKWSENLIVLLCFSGGRESVHWEQMG